MPHRHVTTVLRALVVSVLVVTACTPTESRDTGPRVEIADLKLLTTQGDVSGTSPVRVINKGSYALKIANVRLAPGEQINVAGIKDSTLNLALADFPQTARPLDLKQVVASDLNAGNVVEVPYTVENNARRMLVHTTVVPQDLGRGVQVEGWLYEKSFGAALMRITGDQAFEVSLQNDAPIPHSLDIHFGGMGSSTMVAPGATAVTNSAKVSSTTEAALGFYHCETPPIYEHIRHGMFGPALYEPKGGMSRVDKEFLLSEYAYSTIPNQDPKVVFFNGKADQYLDSPLQVKTGARVRLFLLNGGPLQPIELHFEGVQMDLQFVLDGIKLERIGGQSVVTLIPSSGAVLEFTAPKPGNYVFYDAAAKNIGKGAAGILHVTP